MKTISKLIAKMALANAQKAAGAASQWFTYQSKEPKILKKMIKK